MLCPRCVRSFGFQPLRYLLRGGVGMILDHNMDRLAEGVAVGCHMCAIMLSNLSTLGFSTDGLPPNLGDSMYAKLWYDRSIDFDTGDQRDQVRFDASCSGKIAHLEIKNIPGVLAELLLNMGDASSGDVDTGSDNASAMIKHWVADCSSSHETCRASEDAAAILPTRVIDVGPSDGSQEPRLHITNGATAKYIALSHCWGRRLIIKTTSNNFASHQSSIPVSSLPKTFQDAVSICRKLDIRYLWIDSLCIIQDSDEDWQREARLMGTVYKGAYLTIAAASAKDSSEGCFLPREAQKIRPCWSGMFDGLTPEDEGSAYPLFLRPCRDHISETFAQLRPTLNMGTLLTRGWTLQEQILSRRVLWYHTDMLYWTCLTSEASEQVPEGISGGEFHGMNYWLVVQRAIHGLADLTRPEVVKEIYAAWYRVTMGFSGRDLTYDKDRVYALAGLASEMETIMAKVSQTQRAEPDTFISGLWRKDLWRGLLWMLTDEDYSNVGAKRPQPQLAPSWSWISTKGFINYLTYGSRIKDLEPPDPVEPIVWTWDVHVTVQDISPVPQDISKYNPNTDGKLTIRGPIKDGLPRDKADLTDPVTGERWGVWLRDEEGWAAKTVKCLAVASMIVNPDVQDIDHVWVLLLEPVANSGDTYRRVGAGQISETANWLEGAVESTVHIV